MFQHLPGIIALIALVRPMLPSIYGVSTVKRSWTVERGQCRYGSASKAWLRDGDEGTPTAENSTAQRRDAAGVPQLLVS